MKRALRLATGNAHKLREFTEILSEHGYAVLGTEEVSAFSVIEDGTTFAENAVKKAAALALLTGETTVADDSGLVVDALGGAPGVHSARYAGAAGAGQDAANRHLLLSRMEHLGGQARAARFVCAIAYLVPGVAPVIFEGRLEGHITRAPRGTGGFGYDSLFVPLGQTRTLAELDAAEKHAISHRGIALAQLASHLSSQ